MTPTERYNQRQEKAKRNQLAVDALAQAAKELPANIFERTNRKLKLWNAPKP